MARLAKKYFSSNVLNWSILIAEVGTYGKMIYVEKIIHCLVCWFFKGDQKNLSYQETKNIKRSVLKKRFS